MPKRTMNQPTKGSAIVYARVSTGAQEDGTSLQSQVDACTKHAEALGYIVGRVTQEVYTGAELWDRPKLAQDRAELKAGTFQALIVYALDRLSRDPIHLAIVAEECERAGAELIFVTEPLDTSPEANLIRYVKGYAAKMEREKIRERTLRGKQTRALNGKVHNSGPDLYGYRRDKEAGVRVVHESEAAIVRQIFHWMAIEGLSIGAIVRRLNDQGVPSPSVGKAKFSDPNRVPRWGNSQLVRVLTEPAYKGEAVAWRWKNQGKHHNPVVRPVEEQIQLPSGVAPAVVSTDIWDAVQVRLATNKGEYTRNKAKGRQYLLRGLIVCAVCDCRMYPEPDEGKRAYRCASRQTAAGKCGAKQVGAHDLEVWAWEHVAAVLHDPSIIADEVERRHAAGPDPVLAGDLETAQRRLAKIEKQQQRLIARFGEAGDDDTSDDAATFPWELVEREIATLEREKRQLCITVAEINARLAEQQQITAQLDALHTYCERVGHNLDTFDFDDKRLALEALGVQLRVNGKQWELRGTIPTHDEGGVLFRTSTHCGRHSPLLPAPDAHVPAP